MFMTVVKEQILKGFSNTFLQPESCGVAVLKGGSMADAQSNGVSRSPEETTIRLWVPNTGVLFSLALNAAKSIGAPPRVGGQNPTDRSSRPQVDSAASYSNSAR